MANIRTRGCSFAIFTIGAPAGTDLTTDNFWAAGRTKTPIRLRMDLLYMNRDRSVSRIDGVTGNERDIEVTINGCEDRNSAGKVVRFKGYITGAIALAASTLKVNEVDKFGRPKLDNSNNQIQQTDTIILNESDGVYVEGIFDQTRKGGEIEFYSNSRFDVTLGTKNFEDQMHDKGERRTARPTKNNNSVDRNII